MTKNRLIGFKEYYQNWGNIKMTVVTINEIFYALAELYCNSDTQKKEYIDRLQNVYNSTELTISSNS